MAVKKLIVLVLGANGLLGNMLFRRLSEDSGLEVLGTVRDGSVVDYFSPELRGNLRVVRDLTSIEELKELIVTLMPNVVINCISVCRPIPSKIEMLIPLLSVLPIRLSNLCLQIGARLIHISSDGVFSGQHGGYSEEDIPDARDAYGLAKLLGEVGEGALTLRTSLLGPELGRSSGLLEWFLSQSGECKGYTGSIFSGVTSLELAKCLSEVIIPNPDLRGIFHIASAPCSKFHLLEMLKSEYGQEITINPDDSLQIDRSLNSTKFQKITGYSTPKWENMLSSMRSYKFGLRMSL